MASTCIFNSQEINHPQDFNGAFHQCLPGNAFQGISMKNLKKRNPDEQSHDMSLLNEAKYGLYFPPALHQCFVYVYQ